MPVRIVSPPLCPGFDMVRSVLVPPTVAAGLPCLHDDLNGGGADDFLHWAVPGGMLSHLPAASNSMLSTGSRGGDPGCRGAACAVPPKLRIVTQPDSAGTTPTELMDTDPVSFLRKFDDYLLDLERINVLTLAYRPTPPWLKRALA